MIRTYLICVLIATILVAGYGFLVPWLVSARDTFAVLAGFGSAVVALPVVTGALIKSLYAQHAKKEENK